MKLALFLDITSKRLVRGLYNPDTYELPKCFFESAIPLEITLLEANPSGGTVTPYAVVDATNVTLKVAIGSWSGTTGTKLAYQTSFSKASNVFSGTLDLNTAEMVAAIGASAEITKYLEIEYTESGTVDTAHFPVTVSGEVITAGSPDPSAVSDAEYADQVEAILADTDTVEWERVGDTLEATAVDVMLPIKLISTTEIADVDTEENTVNLTTGAVVGKKYRIRYKRGCVSLVPSNYRVGMYTIAGATGAPSNQIGDNTQYSAQISVEANNEELSVDVVASATTISLELQDITGAYGNNTLGDVPTTFELIELASAVDYVQKIPKTDRQTVAFTAAADVWINPQNWLSRQVVNVTLTGGGGDYTAKLHILRPQATPSEIAQAIDIRVACPATTEPTLEIYDGGADETITGDDTLLDTVASSAAVKVVLLRVWWTGTAWQLWDRKTQGDANASNDGEHATGSHSSGTLTFDLSGPEAETITLSGDASAIAVTNKAGSAAVHRSKLFYLETGSNRTIAWGTAFAFMTAKPGTLTASKRMAVAITSKGTADADVSIWITEQP